MTAYPLARRNQPQWLSIAVFLLASGGAAAARQGAPHRGEGRAAGVPTIPDGNHGDNLPEVTQ